MKTNILKLALVGLLAVVLLTGCGLNPAAFIPGTQPVVASGRVVTESRNVSGYDGLVVDGAGLILIDQTGTESVTVTTDDNMTQYIYTEVQDGKLVIRFAPKVAPVRLSNLTFKVNAKEFKSIQLNGAAIVKATNIAGDRLSVKLTGAGEVNLAGKVDELLVALDGAGWINSEKMEAKRATVTNSGAGAAVVRVSDELHAIIDGLGSIEYIGNPKVTRHISGLGAVSRRYEAGSSN